MVRRYLVEKDPKNDKWAVYVEGPGSRGGDLEWLWPGPVNVWHDDIEGAIKRLRELVSNDKAGDAT